MSDNAIISRDLTRDFGGIRAIDGLSLEMPSGTVFGFLVLPEEWKARAMEMIFGMGMVNAMLASLVIVAALNVIVLLPAMARFRRQRLILD